MSKSQEIKLMLVIFYSTAYISIMIEWAVHKLQATSTTWDVAEMMFASLIFMLMFFSVQVNNNLFDAKDKK